MRNLFTWVSMLFVQCITIKLHLTSKAGDCYYGFLSWDIVLWSPGQRRLQFRPYSGGMFESSGRKLTYKQLEKCSATTKTYCFLLHRVYLKTVANLSVVLCFYLCSFVHYCEQNSKKFLVLNDVWRTILHGHKIKGHFLVLFNIQCFNGI